MGCCDAADRGILLTQLLHAAYTGDCTIVGAKHRLENGGYSIPAAVYIDAMSFYAACTALYIKIPADKAMLSRNQYLRELVEVGTLFAINWVDTRVC